ncbi:iron-containing alcohol dehydrogenase [Kitasatospora sp. RB6PN24]|uniref:hydroxyacid-oxoacid transhydrogenase n=1 Tax=Kitasatospora humi TaxID=2893891 RepID=UPI001E2BB937|nr:hydroxyacid-oxoacid transhydrogenase [Kitasatospora humi]MCC9308326.1 iron-containing alcohol dehydrogenase [Kitasatospora humi]
MEPFAGIGDNAPEHERIIGWQAPPLKFGVGATRELGYELAAAKVRSVLLVTDPGLAALGLPARVAKQLEQEGLSVSLFDRALVEPTDESCTLAARELESLEVDGYVGLGGGSSIDTAKMLNLLLSYPGHPVRDYLNPPIGAGRPIPGPLKPLVAVPTTAGSGSECTAMVALGVTGLNVKTGISDLRLRPTLALVDPVNTLTLPPAVTAASGYDVLTHACESYTARPYDRRPPYPSPADRPLYVGANPISDIWAEEALRLVGRYLRRAVLNSADLEARTGMSRAATFAGMGFGNAGTHIPHACAYPIAGLVRDYRPDGYAVDHAMVPHGAAVVSTAAAAFRFTYPTAPERHLRAAELLGANLNGITAANGADVLPATLRSLVADTGGPGGIAGFGYTQRDLPALVDGALKQQRLLVCCPRDVGARDLQRILAESLAD